MEEREERIDVIAGVRGFNRFYTNVSGLLNSNVADSKYSLAEGRIIYEIGITDYCTANQLSNVLKIDSGYLSRTIKKLEKEKIVERQAKKTDGRVNEISLTEIGQQLFKQIDEASNLQISSLLSPLGYDECKKISHAMDTIKKYLTIAMNDLRIRKYDKDEADLEYIIDRQLSLYNAGRNLTSEIWKKFEIESVLQLVENLDEIKDFILILECNQNRSGYITITHSENKVAQLRYFFLEPELRGIGADKKMLTTAIDFCKERGYEKIFMWTVNTQETVIDLCNNAGFEVIERKENNQMGTLVWEELWNLNLL